VKAKISPAVVGVFVLGALALILGALLYFGGVNFFSKPQRFVVFFDESIHGLDLGSPVKLRGVRVGHVVDLNVRYDTTTNRSVVAVVCEFSRDMIIDEHHQPVDVTDRARLRTMIDHGLRAQLGVIGLATGLLFVELDFYDPHQYPAGAFAEDDHRVVMPAVPSAISEYQASLTEILSDLRRVDFAGLSQKLGSVLTTANDKLQGLDTAGLSARWSRTAEAIETMAKDPEIKKSFANLNAAGDDLRALVSHLDRKVDPTAEQMTQTLKEAREAIAAFNAAAVTIQRFVGSQNGLSEDAMRSLQEIRDAAAAVQRLADFLERNPNAVITGRKGPD
jgi:paraquat-inducible protein B